MVKIYRQQPQRGAQQNLPVLFYQNVLVNFFQINVNDKWIPHLNIYSCQLDVKLRQN
jgi:hypothetical protein